MEKGAIQGIAIGIGYGRLLDNPYNMGRGTSHLLLRCLIHPSPRYPFFGSDGTYIKEANRIAGFVHKIAVLDPFNNYHCNFVQILPHFYVKNFP